MSASLLLQLRERLFIGTHLVTLTRVHSLGISLVEKDTDLFPRRVSVSKSPAGQAGTAVGLPHVCAHGLTLVLLRSHSLSGLIIGLGIELSLLFVSSFSSLSLLTIAARTCFAHSTED